MLAESKRIQYNLFLWGGGGLCIIIIIKKNCELMHIKRDVAV